MALRWRRDPDRKTCPPGETLSAKVFAFAPAAGLTFPMRPIPGALRYAFVFFLAGVAAGCASAPSASRGAATSPGPSPADQTMSRASAEFSLGREAALAGDFECARLYFVRAIDTVRPPGV